MSSGLSRFKKAFDTVSVPTLIDRLESLGFEINLSPFLKVTLFVDLSRLKLVTTSVLKS
jgi:hypothetical protein